MQIGPYQLEREIGRGGMGIVFRARDAAGRVVALKLIPTSDPELLARFEREHKLLAQLGDAGFVPILDAGRDPRGAWLAMPLLTKGTLRDRLRSGGPLPVAEAVALVLSVARAVGAAHERGVVHRDLKPDNVLFADDGRPLVADLGLARDLDASSQDALTKSGMLLGTIPYLAPEQLADSRRAGPAADVFALGATLFELLAGTPPFGTPGLATYAASVRTTRAPRLDEVRPEVPGWLAAVVARALDPDPLLRFTDGADLARALAAGAPPAPPRGTSAALLAAVAVIVVAAATGAVVLAIRSGTSEERSRARALSFLAEAERLRSQRQLDAAVSECARASSEAPGLAEPWLVRARLELERDRCEQADIAATEALARDARSSDALRLRAEARLRPLEQGSAAPIASPVAVRLADEALAFTLRARELAPTDASIWATAARARWQRWKRVRSRDELIAAKQETDRALELDANAVHALELRSTLGVELAAGDRDTLERALRDANRAIDLAPQSGRAWIARCRARRGLGDHAGSLADARRALALDPNDVSALENAGYALREIHWDHNTTEEGRTGLAEALELLSRAIELAPRDAWALDFRMQIRYRLSDYAGCAADASRLLEIEPQHTGALTFGTASHTALRDYDRALASLEALLELDRSEWPCMLAERIAVLFPRDGRARSLLERAHERHPDERVPRFWLGALEADEGHADRALALLEPLAATAGAEQSEARAIRGLIRMQRGDDAGARADLEAALAAPTLLSNFKELARTALDRLRAREK